MAAPVSTPYNRYLRGPVSTAAYPAASGYQINQGDLCVFNSGLLWPVTYYGNVQSWNSGAELQNWSGARNNFAGVALGQNNSTSVVSGSVPVELEGVFSYPYVASSGTTIQPGTWVSFTQADPANPSNSGYFAPQALMQCSGQATAIGKVVEVDTAHASGTSLLTVQLQSTLVFGTLQNA